MVGDKELITIENKTYELQQYKGNHSNEYLLSEIKDGKIEGQCRLFNRGVISLAWTEKDGECVGGILVYDQGKVMRAETWESNMEGGDKRIVYNKTSRVEMTITTINKKNNMEVVIYRGGFDNQLNRNGYGMEYDRENGKESIEGYWERDKLVHIIREFNATKKTVIEYAAGDNIKPWNRVPIYIGGYSITDNIIIRHGVGHLINIKSGMAICEVQYDQGKVTKEINLCEGWYKSILNVNAQFLTKNTTNAVTDEIAVDNTLEKAITLSAELSALTKNIKKITVRNSSCNDMTQFKLNDYAELESVIIGSDCFVKVKTFQIKNLKKLKKLDIGENSFTSKDVFYYTRNYTLRIDSSKADKSKSFEIADCELLESITIDCKSFADFAGGFILDNLPSLRSLTIGNTSNSSYNFLCCPFVIRGTKGITNNGFLMIRTEKSSIDYIRSLRISICSCNNNRR